MSEKVQRYLSSNEWAGWFVLLVGLVLSTSTIVISAQALNATTIWYVLIPGTGIGVLLALIGYIGIRIIREMKETTSNNRLHLAMVIGLALGSGIGALIGLLLGFLALGLSIGCMIGMAAGMLGWLMTRRLTRR